DGKEPVVGGDSRVLKDRDSQPLPQPHVAHLPGDSLAIVTPRIRAGIQTRVALDEGRKPALEKREEMRLDSLVEPRHRGTRQGQTGVGYRGDGPLDAGAR